MAIADTLKFEVATVYINGVNYLGHVEEIERPDVTWATVEHKPIAVRGTTRFPSTIEPMDLTLKFADYSPELTAIASDPYTSRDLMIREAYGLYRGNSRTGTASNIITLKGRFMSLTGGTAKQGEDEREAMMAVDYIKEVAQGTLVREIGIQPPIFNVSGQGDIFSALRTILGI